MIHVKEFEKLETKEELLEKGNLIYDLFLTEDSEFELNITQISIRPIREILNDHTDQISTSLFHRVSHEVSWMLSDSLDRFHQKEQVKRELKKSNSIIRTLSRIFQHELHSSQIESQIKEIQKHQEIEKTNDFSPKRALSAKIDTRKHLKTNSGVDNSDNSPFKTVNDLEDKLYHLSNKKRRSAVLDEDFQNISNLQKTVFLPH